MTGSIVLPINGSLFVCRLSGSDVEPVVPIPGAADARCYTGGSDGHVAIVDTQRKRAGLFALLDQDPWIRRVLPFSTLPSGCKAHTALPIEGGVLVGGAAKSAESLWWRHPEQGQDSWVPLDLPGQLRRPGKAIDGLHRHGDRLIAVDDIVVPKWLVLYQIGDGPDFTCKKQVRLPSHTSYERIRHSCLGEARLWCLSEGVNHGGSSTHIWGVDLAAFKEKACWSLHRPRGWSAAPEGAEATQSPLHEAWRLAEWRGRLLVACGSEGLVQLPPAQRGLKQDPANHRRLAGITLATVTDIQRHPTQPELGVFAIGTEASGAAACQWLPAELLDD